MRKAVRGNPPRQHNTAGLIVSLNDICRRTDLLLLARVFHKLKRYVQRRQQDTHLKRCAVLLKHQAIKKIVSDHFIRWLGTTQRQTSIRSGQREPAKIVVLPRAQDFINLGRRYLARWRLWLRYLRQRHHRNVALLQDKVTQARHHRFFFHWCCVLFQGQKRKLASRIDELEATNKDQTEHIAELKNKLQEQQCTIENLKREAAKLQQHNVEQQKNINRMTETVEAAIRKLAKAGTTRSENEIIRATKDTRHEDDVLFRLLSECTDAASALEKLRKALPDDAVDSGGKEVIADAVCQQMTALLDDTSRMQHELASLRKSDEEMRRLVEELRAHDERWEPKNKRPARSKRSHQTKQLGGSDWDAVLRSRPAELRRALATDAADACHVEPECITNVVVAADGLLSFDVEHDFSVTVEELGRRVDEYPFRAVRRVYQCRAAPKDGLDLLEERLTEKERKLAALREFMEVAVAALGNPDAAPRASEVRRAAEEMARHGDDAPLRLLSECTDAASALEKLRKALPDDAVDSGGKEVIADAVCQQMTALLDDTSRMQHELASLRKSDEEMRRLVEELRAHDERWEPKNKRPARSKRSHQTKQLGGSDWDAVLRSRPAELRRALATDAADACHVEPECITNVVVAADGLLSFDVEHDFSVTVEELGRRVDEYPFRAVRRVYQCRAAPKDGLDLLEERLTEKERKLAALREFMEVAVAALGNPDAAPRASEVRRAAEEMARHGDDAPLRLLSECTDAASALEKLRKALPDDAVDSVGFDAVVDVACERATELNDLVVRLEKELRGARSVAVLLCEALQEGASKVLALVNESSLCLPSSLFSTPDEIDALLHWCGLDSNPGAFGGSLDAKESLDVVKNHLLQEHRLTAEGPSTACVLRSFKGALWQMYERLKKCEERVVEQRGLAGREGEKRLILAKAGKEAVAVLQRWSIVSAGAMSGEMDERQLAQDMKRESELASNTLARLRQLLNLKAVRRRVGRGGSNELRGDEPPILQLPAIETHDDLVNAVSQLYDRAREVGKAYNDMHMAFCQFAPELSQVSDDMGEKLNSAKLPTTPCHDPVRQAELVIRGVHSYIQGKGREVRELRGVMRRGIEALGGTEASDTDDDLVDQTRSAAKSAAVGERLALLCHDTGDAIEDARTALGIENTGKLKLPEVIPNLQNKMHELELVTMESTMLLKEVRSVPTEGPGSPLSLSRNLRPKQKPAALVVDDVKSGMTNAVRLLHPSLSSPEMGSPHVKPDELLRQMRIEIHDKNVEMQALCGACRKIISVLDGSCMANAEPPQYGGLLVPPLTAQAEGLKRALRLAEGVLSSSQLQGDRSVGNYLTVLASQLALMHSKNETLREEISKRTEESTKMASEFNEEAGCLKKQNETLHTRAKSLHDKLETLKQVRQLRAEEMMEILRLRTVKELLRRRIIVWLGRVVATRTTDARGAANEQKRLSIVVVQKQHQQNQVVKLLASALHSLPGETSRNSDVLDTEHALMQRALEGEGVALEAFVRGRIDAANAWMRSLVPVLSSVASLRADTVALRQLITGAWGGGVEGAYRQILADALEELMDSGGQKELECYFLRSRAQDREEIARANRHLSHEVADMKEQLGLAQAYMALQDEKIITLQRENRDLQLSGVMRWDDKESDTSTDAGPSDNLRYRHGVERIMIARAKKLAVEAINAMAGKDLAACIGEVAELTLEMYRRTTAVLEDICNAQNASFDSLSAVTQARLQELHDMRGAQNDIVARLPELFRVPYVN